MASIWLAPILSGCQFCPLGEPVMCTVDAIADHEPNLDCLYHPTFDLTRIGMPDWCACGWNRLTCPHACPDVPRGREPYRALINSVPRGCRVPPDVISSARPPIAGQSIVVESVIVEDEELPSADN